MFERIIVVGRVSIQVIRMLVIVFFCRLLLFISIVFVIEEESMWVVEIGILV